MSDRLSFPKEKIKILLLEGIHESAIAHFEEHGYQVELQSGALGREELCSAISDVHILGIRSKTQVTAEALSTASRLLSIGCFCIGTNQVDLDAAAIAGVPVFNAPFSNTRSVAELTLANIVMLSRKAAHRSMMLHQGEWNKSAAGSHEVRHKTLGIIGYGHIGPQVGLLAESFGMRVVYFDILKKLALGNAQQLSSLDEVLQQSDFVSLHVPETPLTKNLLSTEQLARMKPGACLLNLSRGSVVDVPALADALRSGHLSGAAVDVFPKEPKSNDEKFESELCGLENVILTPHIGGSTVEAQENIGREVAAALVEFVDKGSTDGAVNFPSVDLPLRGDTHRVLNIHKNVPGVLRDINKIVADTGANVMAQSLSTQGEVGYLIMDVDPSLSREVKASIDGLPSNIRTRLLF